MTMAQKHNTSILGKEGQVDEIIAESIGVSVQEYRSFDPVMQEEIFKLKVLDSSSEVWTYLSQLEEELDALNHIVDALDARVNASEDKPFLEVADMKPEALADTITKDMIATDEDLKALK